MCERKLPCAVAVALICAEGAGTVSSWRVPSSSPHRTRSWRRIYRRPRPQCRAIPQSRPPSRARRHGRTRARLQFVVQPGSIDSSARRTRPRPTHARSAAVLVSTVEPGNKRLLVVPGVAAPTRTTDPDIPADSLLGRAASSLASAGVRRRRHSPRSGVHGLEGVIGNRWRPDTPGRSRVGGQCAWRRSLRGAARRPASRRRSHVDRRVAAACRHRSAGCRATHQGAHRRRSASRCRPGRDPLGDRARAARHRQAQARRDGQFVVPGNRRLDAEPGTLQQDSPRPRPPHVPRRCGISLS